ncbi:hypothetical protein N0V86_003998 [Didymella sp. IMI 355093]|nr:hypothetical protein N0V86_003998 [Didymella sp. IMI 355093]
MNTPSPVTPEFAAFDGMSQGMPSPSYNQDHYFTYQNPVMREHPMQLNGMLHNNEMKPVVALNEYAPHMVNQAAYHAQPQPYYNSPQMPEQHVQAAAPAAASARPKKNAYPCPLSKTYHCTDMFTTSGHAARHAKKHTGKKDAFCPECNKAFTRKDNMEQHRRTHQSGRSAKGSDNGVKKAKVAARRPRPSPLQSSAQVQLHSVDPVLRITPHSTGFMAPAVQPAEDVGQDSGHYTAQYSPHAYPDPSQYSMTLGYNVGSHSALDALAIAASGEKRKFE